MGQNSSKITPVVKLVCFSGFLLVFFVIPAEGIRWPFDPGDESLPLGNNYGEYQYYGGSPYLHPGIDILQPFGSPVYAVKSGIVKAVLTISGQYHWRVAVGDSSGADWCDGWLYAHLDQSTIQVQVGESVEEGDYLGDLVWWPVANFHHLHFVKIRNHGVTWSSDWEFIANPLDELVPIDEPDPPVIEDAREDYKFAFCYNMTHDYFDPATPLSGSVDIISKIYDKTNHPYWRMIPYQIEYSIFNDSVSFGPELSFIFTDTLFWDQNVNVIYQEDDICYTQGDYDYRNFYFIITNTDGDSVVEAEDQLSGWNSQEFPDGNYWVKVTAYDRYGNSDSDSMEVEVENYFEVAGKVGLSDNPPDSSGSVIQIWELAISDTTDLAGSFFFEDIGSGHYLFQITHPGYLSIDTVVQVSQNLNLYLTLSVGPYIRGDANHDQLIDLGDMLYLISYLFKNGPSPIPFFSGDASSDTVVDFTDVLYLINYLYRGGPSP